MPKSNTEIKNSQSIHNFIVRNFGDNITSYEYSKPMYLCSLLILCKSNTNIVEEFYKKPNTLELYKDTTRGKLFFKYMMETLDEYAAKYKVLLEMKKSLKLIFDKCNNADYSKDTIFALVELGKDIYNKIESGENYVIQDLFDQFFKYIGKGDMKNSEWTPAHTASIMTELINIYPDILSECINVLEPCIGAGNLVNALRINMKNNFKITGYEVKELPSNIATIDSIVTNSYNEILITDFITKVIPEETTYDLTITNPPFTRNISGYEALHFVIKSMLYSKHGIFILPSSQLKTQSPTISILGREILENFAKIIEMNSMFVDKKSEATSMLKTFSTQFQKEWKKINNFKKFICKATISDMTNYLVEKYHIDFIINLGSGKNIFRSGSAGEIAIIALSKPEFKPFDETKFYDFPIDNTTVKKVNKQNIYNFTILGEEYLKNILLTTETRNIVAGSNWIRVGDIFYENCKNEKLEIFKNSKHIKQLVNEIISSDVNQDIKNVRLIKTIAYEKAKAELIKCISSGEIYIDFAKKCNLNDFIPQDVLTLLSLDETRFRKVKLTELFTQLKSKTVKIGDCVNEGTYPVIGASKINNGVVVYLEEFAFEASETEPLWTLCKDGTVGVMFKQTKCFNINSHVYVLKPNVDIDEINQIIFTTYLTSLGFDFNNSINTAVLDTLEIYVYN